MFLGNKNMFKFESFVKKGKEKAKKMAKIGTLAIGIGAGVISGHQEAGAQNVKDTVEVDTRKNEYDRLTQKFKEERLSPDLYDLSDKQDISEIKRAEQISPEKKLQANIKEVKNMLYTVKNRIYLNFDGPKTDFREPSEDELKEEEELIKEYEEYLISPSLDVKKVGELEFSEENFERNKDAYRYYDSKIEDIAKHIASEDYLKKLMVEYDIDETQALEHQRVRLKNLRNGTYSLSMTPNFSSLGKNFSTELYKNYTEAEFSTEHEILGHKVVGGGGRLEISPKAGRLMSQSSLPINWENEEFSQLLKNIENTDEREAMKLHLGNYFRDAAERYARKQELEMEMEILGIKKYGDKFTNEHYLKLMDLYQQGKLSFGSRQFISTTNSEYFEAIFNEIAENNNENYYHPEWHYQEDDNQDYKA